MLGPTSFVLMFWQRGEFSSLDGNTAAPWRPRWGGLSVCCVTSRPQGLPALLTGQGEEEAAG